jgi:hypothetical protein
LDVLELVEKKLLRMRPNERAECKEIFDKFRDFHNRCQEEWYCTKPIYRPQRTPSTLSELVASPIATSFHKEEAYQLAPERRTSFDIEMEPDIEMESDVENGINGGE